jgi:hypothetical protein
MKGYPKPLYARDWPIFQRMVLIQHGPFFFSAGHSQSIPLQHCPASPGTVRPGGLLHVHLRGLLDGEQRVEDLRPGPRPVHWDSVVWCVLMQDFLFITMGSRNVVGFGAQVSHHRTSFTKRAKRRRIGKSTNHAPRVFVFCFRWPFVPIMHLRLSGRPRLLQRPHHSAAAGPEQCVRHFAKLSVQPRSPYRFGVVQQPHIW